MQVLREPAPVDEPAALARWRGRWAATVAVVVLLAIPVSIFLVMRHADRRDSAGWGPGSSLGNFDWSSAVLHTDDRTVTVAVNIPETLGYCGVPAIVGSTSEAANSVTIRTEGLRTTIWPPTSPPPLGSHYACGMPGLLPMPFTVTLKRPLGSRALIDATTGRHHRIFDASTLLSPSYLPAGYRDQGVQWFEDAKGGPATHEYAGPGGTLRVVRGGVESPFSPADEQLLATGKVLGHPAKLVRAPFSGSLVCVLWRDSHYPWQVCSEASPGSPTAPLDAGELLRIANSLH